MKKGAVILVIVIVAVAGIFLWIKNSYNGLVKSDEAVNAAWSQVENVYQRRLDLIDNLVSTVKGYAEHEQSTLDSVIEARAKANQVRIDPSNLTPEDIARYQEAQGEFGQALSRLMVTYENYPDLKANQNFLELQAELAGTENRIATERRKFNEAARAYNTKVRSFPTNILASMFGFQTKGYFEADAAASSAPKVEF